MKKILLLLLLSLLQNGYSQTLNYDKYYNQLIQKAQNIGTEMGSNWKKSTQFATRSTNKDIYTLYINGNKVASFCSEFDCRGQITIFKRKLESLPEMMISVLPSNVPKSEVTQIRNGMKTHVNNYINDLNCVCRKEMNPNYRTLTNQNNSNANSNVFLKCL